MIWNHIRAGLDTGAENDVAGGRIAGVAVPVGPPPTHGIADANIGMVFCEKVEIIEPCHCILRIHSHRRRKTDLYEIPALNHSTIRRVLNEEEFILGKGNLAGDCYISWFIGCWIEIGWGSMVI